MQMLPDEHKITLKGILSKSKLEDKVFYVPPMELQEQFATFFSKSTNQKLPYRRCWMKPRFFSIV